MRDLNNYTIIVLYENREAVFPVAGTDMLLADIASSSIDRKFEIELVPTVSGILTVVLTKDAVETTMNIYGGSPLTANGHVPYQFIVLAGESVNFRYSAGTGVEKYRFIVNQVG